MFIVHTHSEMAMPKAVLSIKEKVNVIEIHKNEKLSARELAKKM